MLHTIATRGISENPKVNLKNLFEIAKNSNLNKIRAISNLLSYVRGYLLLKSDFVYFANLLGVTVTFHKDGSYEIKAKNFAESTINFTVAWRLLMKSTSKLKIEDFNEENFLVTMRYHLHEYLDKEEVQNNEPGILFSSYDSTCIFLKKKYFDYLENKSVAYILKIPRKKKILSKAESN